MESTVFTPPLFTLVKDNDKRTFMGQSEERSTHSLNFELVEENIYYFAPEDKYYQKSTTIVMKENKRYIQENYTDITSLYKRIIEDQRIIANLNKNVISLKKSLQQASQAIETLKKDYLTQLPSRLSLKEKQTQLMKNYRSCVMAICDVNDFKVINDTLGHKAGDKSLAALARLFENNTREQDLIVRYGGDEFLFIFETDDISAIYTKMEIIRKNVEKLGQEIEVPLSISTGLSLYTPTADWEHCLEKADQALLYVKQNGKNATAYYDSITGDYISTLTIPQKKMS